MSVSHISLSLGGSLELIFDPASIAGCTAALTLTGFVEELRRHDGSVALFDESLSQVFCDILLNSLQALGCQPTNDHVARLQLEARELVRAIGVHNISAPSYHWLEAKLQESIRLRSGVCAPINRIDQRQVGRHHVAQSIEDSL